MFIIHPLVSQAGAILLRLVNVFRSLVSIMFTRKVSFYLECSDCSAFLDNQVKTSHSPVNSITLFLIPTSVDVHKAIYFLGYERSVLNCVFSKRGLVLYYS